MIKILEKLFGLIYIQPCLICGSTKEDRLICSKCFKKINFLPYGVFRKENDCNIYACTIYDDVTKKLIKDLKYNNKKKLAAVHAQIMYSYWKELNKDKNYIIIPVPIHKNRLKERKYNHMDIVAEEFAKLTGYNLDKNLLTRKKDTIKQYNLHKSERIKNIKDAFEITKSPQTEKGANLLIIDDITSTGITLNEIIKLLKNNGYEKVTALALSTPDIWNN